MTPPPRDERHQKPAPLSEEIRRRTEEAQERRRIAHAEQLAWEKARRQRIRNLAIGTAACLAIALLLVFVLRDKPPTAPGAATKAAPKAAVESSPAPFRDVDESLTAASRLIADGKPAEALDAIRELEKSGAVDARHQVRFHIIEGDAMLALDRQEDAIASYREALPDAGEDDRAALQNNLAFIATLTGGDLTEAESLSRAALTHAPRNFAYLDTLVTVLRKQGRSDELIRVVKRALPHLATDDERATAYIWIGDAHLEAFRLLDATIAWRMSVALKPENAEIWQKIQAFDPPQPTPSMRGPGR